MLSTVSICNYSTEVLRLIINRLMDHHFYPPAEYGPRTRILGYILPPPLDVNDDLTEEELSKAADNLLLQIREGGYETFVKLPQPLAVELTSTTTDAKTGVSVRYVRSYDVVSGTFLTRFDIGVHV